ncbi:MAG: glycosyltransferase family 4 protein [Vampirovibrionales bacterium]|nr:glycosyltransferase family 4 protein [Vampirovibrionales bacterium]
MAMTAKKPIILHIYPDFGQMGGIERYLLQTCAATDATQAWQTVVICNRGGTLHKQLAAQKTTVYGIKSFSCFKNANLRWLDAFSMIQILRLIRVIQPNLIHLHIGGLETAIYPAVLKRPTLLTLHGYGTLYSMAGVQNRLKRLIKHALRLGFNLAARQMHGITCVSQAEKSRLLAEGYLPQRPQAQVIPNGLNLEAWQAQLDTQQKKTPSAEAPPYPGMHHYQPGEPIIVWLGRLDAVKQPEHFIQIARQLSQDFPKAWWVLAGDGDLFNAIASSVVLEPIPRLLCVGHQPAASVLAHATCLLHTPSAEGFGLSVLEAMASGVPVISYAVGGVPELLAHFSECLSPPNDPLALAERLRRFMHLLQTNPDAKIRLSQALLTRANTNYSEAQMMQTLLACYQRLLYPQALTPPG